jgi:hypothetical protein
MSDRETLLGMGFDPARVDCERYTHRVLQFPGVSHRSGISRYVGALKATSNRGV